MDRISSLDAELAGRNLRYSSPEIIMLEGVPVEPGSLTPPGTVACFVANQGSPLLGQIRAAAYRKDYEELRRHGTSIATDCSGISRRRETLLESLSDIPVLTEFRYGGRTVARAMFTSATLEVATASVLYGGGPLHDDAFQAVDYFRAEISPETEHLVVVSLPSLTELERAIASRVPEAHSEGFVSMPGIVEEAEAHAVEESALDETIGHQEEELRAPDEIGDSGTLTTASAHTLLKIRMQLRKRRHPR